MRSRLHLGILKTTMARRMGLSSEGPGRSRAPIKGAAEMVVHGRRDQSVPVHAMQSSCFLIGSLFRASAQWRAAGFTIQVPRDCAVAAPAQEHETSREVRILGGPFTFFGTRHRSGSQFSRSLSQSRSLSPVAVVVASARATALEHLPIASHFGRSRSHSAPDFSGYEPDSDPDSDPDYDPDSELDPDPGSELP